MRELGEGFTSDELGEVREAEGRGGGGGGREGERAGERASLQNVEFSAGRRSRREEQTWWLLEQEQERFSCGIA